MTKDQQILYAQTVFQKTSGEKLGVGVGDLVAHHDEPDSFGVVVKILHDVEVPPLIEILWTQGFSRVYQDELTILNKVKNN